MDLQRPAAESGIQVSVWIDVRPLGGIAEVLVTSSAESGSMEEFDTPMIAGVTNDLIGRLKAGDLVKHVAAQVGGKGGGRADMAQAGGSDPEALPEALASVPAWVEEQLG